MRRRLAVEIAVWIGAAALVTASLVLEFPDRLAEPGLDQDTTPVVIVDTSTPLPPLVSESSVLDVRRIESAFRGPTPPQAVASAPEQAPVTTPTEPPPGDGNALLSYLGNLTVDGKERYGFTDRKRYDSFFLAVGEERGGWTLLSVNEETFIFERDAVKYAVKISP